MANGTGLNSMTIQKNKNFQLVLVCVDTLGVAFAEALTLKFQMIFLNLNF